MALAFYFNAASMDITRYDEVTRRLEAAGAGEPPGRLYHACFGSDEKLQVFDIWESQQHFDNFGETLLPILQEVGVDPGQPVVERVHNLIPGQQ